MDACDTCGNPSSTLMTIAREGVMHTFDSFECAIHSMAPTCRECGCRILGHGTHLGGYLYCCDHCAPASSTGLRIVSSEGDDRLESEAAFSSTAAPARR
ncbi:hypothetical protein H4W26_000423 [Nesterenkonia halotolerans]|uniref:Metallothionein n=1 Tax=Nesterenkonia halotolerans TaxID=225325 RepID=A0ABR9J3T0_9MICC|nr:hypothetical protein [Nesterenkonia halotolerans]